MDRLTVLVSRPVVVLNLFSWHALQPDKRVILNEELLSLKCKPVSVQ
jgi:hypothetical protein